MNRIIRYHEIKCDPLPGEFIATEKIHGSNLGIGYLKNSLRLQTRNEIIEKDFQHFGLPEKIDSFIQIVKKLKGILNYNFLVFGEIFGKTIPMMNYYDPVSEDVFRRKQVFFRAFDLYNVDEKTFLKYSAAIELFIKVGLPYVPILNIHYKTTDDLYDIVEKYQSAFSEKFVEGFVLKKDETELKRSRNIFKIKGKEFRPSNVQLLNKNKIKSYIDIKRFRSAYSKIGDYPEKIKQEMIQDSLKDIAKVISDEIKQEVEENYERLHKKYKKEQERGK